MLNINLKAHSMVKEKNEHEKLRAQAQLIFDDTFLRLYVMSCVGQTCITTDTPIKMRYLMELNG